MEVLIGGRAAEATSCWFSSAESNFKDISSLEDGSTGFSCIYHKLWKVSLGELRPLEEVFNKVTVLRRPQGVPGSLGEKGLNI